MPGHQSEGVASPAAHAMSSRPADSMSIARMYPAPGQSSSSAASGDSISIIFPEENLQALPASARQRWLRRQAGNAGAIAARNLASVAVPTAVREFLRRYVFTRIAHGGAGVALGAVAGYLPCVMETAGLYRDINNHTYTGWTVAGRLACIVLSGAGVTTLIAIGAMGTPAAAALMAANFVYTPLRDVIQNYIHRHDNLSDDARSERICALLGAAAFMPNQFVVNEVMQYWTDGLTPHVGRTGANVLARAVVNFFGECVDDVVTLGSKAALTGTELEAHTRFSPPSEHDWTNIKDKILNVHAGRSALFSTVLGGAYLTDAASARYPSNHGHVSLALESATVGLCAGLAYLPFRLSLIQNAAAQDRDPEAGLPVGTEVARQFPVTSVRFINEMQG